MGPGILSVACPQSLRKVTGSGPSQSAESQIMTFVIAARFIAEAGQDLFQKSIQFQECLPVAFPGAFQDIGQPAEMVLMHMSYEQRFEVVQRETAPDQQSQHRSARIDQDSAVSRNFLQGRGVEPFLSGITVRSSQRGDLDWHIQKTGLPLKIDLHLFNMPGDSRKIKCTPAKTSGLHRPRIMES